MPARRSPGRIRRCDASLGHGWLSGSGLPTVDPAVDQARLPRLPAASTRKGRLFFLYLNHSVKDLLLEEGSDVARYLLSKVRALFVHGQQHTLDAE